MKKSPKFFLVILGETAVGKTKVANEIAKIKNGEIIVADKFYIYNFFKNSVGRTDAEYEVPTHLMGLLQPSDTRISREDYSEKVEKIILDVINRGCLPVVEGCSVGFISSLLNNNLKNKNIGYIVIGLKFPKYINPRDVYRSRFLKLLNEGTVIEEVEEAIKSGYADSYVMQKSVICKPISRFLNREISLNEAVDEVVKGYEKVALNERKSFESIEGVHWIEHDDVFFKNTIQNIAEIMDLYF